MDEQGGFFDSTGFWMGMGLGQGWGSGSLGENIATSIGGKTTVRANPFSPSRFINPVTGKARVSGAGNRLWYGAGRLWRRGPEPEMARAKAMAFSRYQERALSGSINAGRKAYSQGVSSMARSFGKTFSTYADMGGAVKLPFMDKTLTGAAGRYVGMARLGTSILARGAFTAMNALFVADLARMAVGGAIGTMIELGKPRELQPRFYHTPVNMTMRQAGLSAIHASQLQTRSALGSEASALHM